MKWINGLMAVLLIWNSITDIKKRKISFLSVGIFGGLWIVLCIALCILIMTPCKEEIVQNVFDGIVLEETSELYIEIGQSPLLELLLMKCLLQLLEMKSFFAAVLLGILPGLILCAVGVLSRGTIGLGDGILVTMIGLYIGNNRTVVMMAWAFFAAFFWSIFLLLVQKRKRQEAFPFVPFLALGWIATLFMV